jgi:hypothetical protein
LKFIRAYDAFDKEYCEEVIRTFDKCQEAGYVRYRDNVTHTVDSQIDMNVALEPTSMELGGEFLADKFFPVIKDIIPQYVNDAHMPYVPSHWFRNMLVQRTDNNCGGYHQWHCEASCHASMDRWLVYTLYLNDIPEGEGETEFLHQNYRYQPKQGQVVIWPAGFTYIHRGNPIRTTTKYIATGWVHFAPEMEEI